MDGSCQHFSYNMTGPPHSHFPVTNTKHARRFIPNSPAAPAVFHGFTSNDSSLRQPDRVTNIPIEIENLSEFNTNFGLRANKQSVMSNQISDNMNKQMQTMQENMLVMHQQMQERFKQMNLPHMPPLPMVHPMNTNHAPMNTNPINMAPHSGYIKSPTPSPLKSINNDNTSEFKDYSPRLKYVSKTLPIPVKGSTKKEIVPEANRYNTLPTKSTQKHVHHTPNSSRSLLQSMISKDSSGTDKLKLAFDMADFKPEEISISKDKNHLQVNAHHEDKQPDKISCRVFHQSYNLPKDMRITKLNSMVNKDGTLIVDAPIKPRHRVTFADVKD